MLLSKTWLKLCKKLGISDELIQEVGAVAAAPSHKMDVLNQNPK